MNIPLLLALLASHQTAIIPTEDGVPSLAGLKQGLDSSQSPMHLGYSNGWSIVVHDRHRPVTLKRVTAANVAQVRG